MYKTIPMNIKNNKNFDKAHTDVPHLGARIKND